SPSGLEIVFRAEGELWAMDTVLREPNRITRSDARENDAVFSRDGQFIYYTKDDGLECQIWRMKRTHPNDYWWQTESFEHQEPALSAEPKRRVSRSPDGRKLAYIQGSGDLLVADADGQHAQVLFECWNAPSFDSSPDGEWIVFAAQDQNFNRDIYIV